MYSGGLGAIGSIGIAMIALFFLVAAGVLMSDLEMPELDALWTTVVDKVATR